MNIQKYLIRDARFTLKTFKQKSIPSPGLIITSPPYFNIKDYGGIPKQIGLGQQYDKYLSDVVSVLQQCYEISDKKASLWMVLDTISKNSETIPLPFDLLNKLKNSNGTKTWILRDIIVWHKVKNTPWHNEGKFRNHFEYILFFTKNDNFIFNIDSLRDTKNYKKWWLSYPERYNSNGRPITNIWDHTAPIRGWGDSKQNHMCSLPFALLEKIIELASNKGDLIFDPFGGSGSAIALAKCMGRDGIAFDINPSYRELFKKEVIIAANRYWIKRKKEKEEILKLNKKFRLQNIALRKLKSTSLLLSAIDKTQNYKTILTTPSKNSNKLSIVLYIPNIGIKAIKSKIRIEKSKIEKTMKTQIEIKIFTLLGFQKKLNTRKIWYVYDLNKFYKQIEYSNSILFKTNGIISNINFSLPADLDKKNSN